MATASAQSQEYAGEQTTAATSSGLSAPTSSLANRDSAHAAARKPLRIYSQRLADQPAVSLHVFGAASGPPAVSREYWPLSLPGISVITTLPRIQRSESLTLPSSSPPSRVQP